MEKMSSIIRREFKKGDDIRDAGLTAPDDVIRYKDIAYGKDSAMQVLDVYRPKDTEGNLPVIVSVHGGGWVYGDKELYQYYCMSIAQRGFAVVNFTYRLAPEYQFPAPMEDTNSVFAWILDNKDKYGMDVANLFAVGDSAGGQILSLYADICTNAEYAKEYNFQVPEGLKIKAVALNCGQYNMEDTSDMTRQLMDEYLPGKGTTPEYALRYVLSAAGLGEDDVTLEFKSEASEVASVLAEDPNAIGLLPQPFVTAALAQNEKLSIIMDLTKEWDNVQGEGSGSRLVTGVTIVNNDFLKEHEDLVDTFLQEHEASIAFTAEDPDAAAELIAKAEIVAKAPIAKKALPYCNITFISGDEMKTALSGYLQALYDQNPTSVGGALPDDSFYYVK